MSRITGLATGLDIDALVEETMNAYQTKIDTVQQQKEIAEIQQTLYRDVITDCRNFYSDYFDITKSDSLFKSANWSSVSFESSSNAVTVTGNSTAEVANYSVDVKQLASAATYTIKSDSLNSTIEINGVNINLSGASTNSKKVELINTALKDQGITAKYSEFAQGIVLTSDTVGTSGNFTISGIEELNNISASDLTGKTEYSFEIEGKTITVKEESSGVGIKLEQIEEAIKDASIKGVSAELKGDNLIIKTVEHTIKGNDAEVVITNGDGIKYIHTGSDNKVTLDGVTFQFNNTTSESNPAVVTGKTDVSAVKDRIVSFVNDYNTLLEKLNTLVNETRDTDYMPLTSAQKAEMSESEIELWEKKVKEGQLSRDSDLKRIISSMKSAMQTVISGASTTSGKMGLTSIGINLVSDYSGSKVGTLKIDEEKLDEALKNNLEDVKNLFTGTVKKADGETIDTSAEPISIMYKLKKVFDTETQKSSGSLLKKAGMEGESTVTNNTLSQKIAKYKSKITLMNSIFKRKQQALYTKYASLETAMNNMNSQISYLQSYSS